MAMLALQAPTGLCHSPDLVAQSPRVPILALAAVGKSIKGHAFPMDTSGRDREENCKHRLAHAPARGCLTLLALHLVLFPRFKAGEWRGAKCDSMLVLFQRRA